jgi:transcriptional regulator with XRE-family HTH domain
MLTSPGSLLRAWRKAHGWTQADLAAEVHVTAAAVSAWETGVRGIPLRALERLDAAFGARGCLVDLARSVGTGSLEPRPRWGHAFHGEPGPVWAWIRPAGADRVRGLARFRVVAYRLDHEVGPEGLFMVAPRLDPNWAVQVLTDCPVWVDFGRGAPPEWLGVPTVSSLGLRDIVLTHPTDPMLAHFIETFRRMDHGDPATLRSRLRALVDDGRWDALEHQWRLGADAPDPSADVMGGGPRPPREAGDQRDLHRRLRTARGLSQAEAAEAATRLLRSHDEVRPPSGGPTRAVSAMQIHNYESGRTGRVRHLPALLDMAYDAYGFSCFERVRTSRARTDALHVHLPDFWLGPVTLAARRLGSRAGEGPMTLRWRHRRIEVSLPHDPVSFGCNRFPEDGDLTVEVPDGWTVDSWMGFDPDAQELLTDWVPVSADAGQVIFDRALASLRLAVGVSECDLRRALADSNVA